MTTNPLEVVREAGDMTDITTTKPDWVTIDNSWVSASYDAIVESWGFEVLSADQTGSYQGDNEWLLKDGERYGMLVSGYGSCSGCDWLEGAIGYRNPEEITDWSDLHAISIEMKTSVHWEDSALALADWLIAEQADPDRKAASWFWFDDEVKAVAEKYIGLLREGKVIDGETA